MTQKFCSLSGLKQLLVVLFLCVFVPETFGVNNSENPDNIFIVSEVDNGKAYKGEWITLTVTLYSDNPDIMSVYPISNPDFNGFSVYDMGGDRRIGKTKYKGKERYSVVISRWCISSENAGKFKIEIPDYVVGIPVERIVDTIWGRRKVRTEQSMKVSCKPLDIKINQIPPVPEGFNFSGAVGQYDIEVWVPAGEVVKDQEAVAMVSVSGVGSLQNASIPKVLPAFQNNDVKLKNVSEDRKNFIKENSLYSEIELQCSFIPLSEGKLSLGSIKFGYFDTISGKYRYAESTPVSFDVESYASVSTSPVIIGI